MGIDAWHRDHREVLARAGWLTQNAFWPRQMRRGIEQAVSFWRWEGTPGIRATIHDDP
jgi:hypothetical protein